MTTPDMDDQKDALALWRERLAYMEREEAKAADANSRFSIQKEIEEVRLKISELESRNTSVKQESQDANVGTESRNTSGSAHSGADLRYDLNISFEEAAFGKTVCIQVPRLETCEVCSGRDAFCKNCRGHGRINIMRDLEITIPAGVDTGLRLRLRGEGDHGLQEEPPGDLDVLLSVDPHDFFERDGTDVYSRLPLTYSQLLEGASVDVSTLRGMQRLHVPERTSPGQEFRFHRQGIEDLHDGGLGDHVACIELKFPPIS